MPSYNPGNAALSNPSINDPRVGTELRRFRERCEISGDSVAKGLKWSPSKISRYECGRTGIGRRALEQILRYYTERHAMAAGQAQAIMAMFEQSLEMARFLHEFIGPAVLASVVREWSTRYVPRLLQTHDYATAVLRDLQPATGMSPGDVRDVTAAVATWQTRLTATPPVRLHALLDESVLYRLAGSPEIMRAQLEHLERIAAAGETDIELRVLPFAAAGAARWTAAFSYLEYATVPGADWTAEVVTEELDGPGQHALSEKQVWHRFQLWTRLWDAADEAGPAIKKALADAWS